MRHFIFILFILFGLQSLAQDVAYLTVKCLDEESKSGVHNATVKITQNNGLKSAESNELGESKFTIDPKQDFVLEIKHGFYQSFRKEIKTGTYQLRDSLFELQFELSPKVQNIKTMIALAPGVPKAIYQSKIFSVSDFEVLPNDEILLLLYPKTLKKGGELAILDGEDIRSQFEVPEKPLELIHDFRGNAHVVCEKGVYGVHREDNKIGISNLERDYFMKYIFPIVDTAYSRFYFSNFNKNYPAFDYKIFDQLDSTYSDIVEIKDELMMELYRSEYKWVDVRTKLWAKQKEIETGIDKEIWVGANYFTQSIYYKELYAPLFKKNDTIFIFDYYKDKLFSFNLRGEKLDSVSIFHHYEPRKTGWKKNLIQDKITGEIYAFFEKDGFCSLRLVNTKTGQLENNVVFQHKYIDKVAVSGGSAYYIYRPFESAQKKFLYTTKLPLKNYE